MWLPKWTGILECQTNKNPYEDLQTLIRTFDGCG